MTPPNKWGVIAGCAIPQPIREKYGDQLNFTANGSSRLAIFRSTVPPITELIFAAGRAGADINPEDAAEITANGTALWLSPTGSAEDVAEALNEQLLLLARNMIRARNYNATNHSQTEVEAYKTKGEIKGWRLNSGKYTAGIIGYGNYGPYFASLLKRAYPNMPILVFDIDSKRRALAENDGFTTTGTIEELLVKVDILSVHVPKRAGIVIKEEHVALLKDTVICLNPSRGGSYDERALLKKMERISQRLNEAEGKIKEKMWVAGLKYGTDFNTPEAKLMRSSHPFNVDILPHILSETYEGNFQTVDDVTEPMLVFANTGTSIGSMNIPDLTAPVCTVPNSLVTILAKPDTDQNALFLESLKILDLREPQIQAGDWVCQKNKHFLYLVINCKVARTATVIDAISNLDGVVRTRLI